MMEIILGEYLVWYCEEQNWTKMTSGLKGILDSTGLHSEIQFLHAEYGQHRS